MEDRDNNMQRFFTACDELITGKYILADKKIGELLRSVAVCNDLMGLFSAVMQGFDYQAAKRAYLRSPEETHSAHGTAYLPEGDPELLAFVFCLLVEIDSGAIRLNDFLIRYFYEDGSYTASYALFVERMIRPFRDIVRRCFPESEGGVSLQRRKEDGILAAIGEKLAIERGRLPRLGLSEEDAFAGDTILSELVAAVGRRDLPVLKALLCGYLYFLQVVKCSDQNSSELFLLAGEL